MRQCESSLCFSLHFLSNIHNRWHNYKSPEADPTTTTNAVLVSLSFCCFFTSIAVQKRLDEPRYHIEQSRLKHHTYWSKLLYQPLWNDPLLPVWNQLHLRHLNQVFFFLFNYIYCLVLFIFTFLLIVLFILLTVAQVWYPSSSGQGLQLHATFQSSN